jgi:hypothetical protein
VVWRGNNGHSTWPWLQGIAAVQLVAQDVSVRQPLDAAKYGVFIRVLGGGVLAERLARRVSKFEPDEHVSLRHVTVYSVLCNYRSPESSGSPIATALIYDPSYDCSGRHLLTSRHS